MEVRDSGESKLPNWHESKRDGVFVEQQPIVAFERPSVGSKRALFGRVQTWSDGRFQGVRVCCLCGSLLPPMVWNAYLLISHFWRVTSQPCRQSCPQWLRSPAARVPIEQVWFLLTVAPEECGLRLLGCLRWIAWTLSDFPDQQAVPVSGDVPKHVGGRSDTNRLRALRREASGRASKVEVGVGCTTRKSRRFGPLFAETGASLVLTNSVCSSGVPSIITSCSSRGKSRSPRHTIASGPSSRQLLQFLGLPLDLCSSVPQVCVSVQERHHAF